MFVHTRDGTQGPIFMCCTDEGWNADSKIFIGYATCVAFDEVKLVQMRGGTQPSIPLL